MLREYEDIDDEMNIDEDIERDSEIAGENIENKV